MNHARTKWGLDATKRCDYGTQDQTVYHFMLSYNKLSTGALEKLDDNIITDLYKFVPFDDKERTMLRHRICTDWRVWFPGIQCYISGLFVTLESRLEYSSQSISTINFLSYSASDIEYFGSVRNTVFIASTAARFAGLRTRKYNFPELV